VEFLLSSVNSLINRSNRRKRKRKARYTIAIKMALNQTQKYKNLKIKSRTILTRSRSSPWKGARNRY
jgi:hypothetical protein